jgi:hypothetical protein
MLVLPVRRDSHWSGVHGAVRRPYNSGENDKTDDKFTKLRSDMQSRKLSFSNVSFNCQHCALILIVNTTIVLEF